MTQNILGPQKAFIRHWMSRRERKREQEQKDEKIVVQEIGKERRDGGRRNEILANAFVFTTWLHRDVTMEVIGIARVSQYNNSVCACNRAYTCCGCGIRSAMLCRVLFAA